MSNPLDQLLGAEGELLQALAEQSHDCIKLISLDGHVEFISASGRAQMSLGGRDGLIGAHWTELWPGECHAEIHAAIRDAGSGQRARFEAFDPDMAGTQRWWEVTVSPVRAASGEISRLLATSRDVTDERIERRSNTAQRERAEAEADAHDIVAREMRHRLKNLLAMVSSIARLSGRQAERTADFLPIFLSRLNDLSAAQHLLTEHSDQRADLPALVETLLDSEDGDQRIRIGPVPAVRIQENSTRVVALVLGELLTNARKYGALSGEGGSLELEVEANDKEVQFTWTEHGERPIASDPSPGSGTVLMQRMTAREPHPLTIDWNECGIVARFSVRI